MSDIEETAVGKEVSAEQPVFDIEVPVFNEDTWVGDGWWLALGIELMFDLEKDVLKPEKNPEQPEGGEPVHIGQYVRDIYAALEAIGMSREEIDTRIKRAYKRNALSEIKPTSELDVFKTTVLNNIRTGFLSGEIIVQIIKATLFWVITSGQKSTYLHVRHDGSFAYDQTTPTLTPEYLDHYKFSMTLPVLSPDQARLVNANFNRGDSPSTLFTNETLGDVMADLAAQMTVMMAQALGMYMFTQGYKPTKIL